MIRMQCSKLCVWWMIISPSNFVTCTLNRPIFYFLWIHDLPSNLYYLMTLIGFTVYVGWRTNSCKIILLLQYSCTQWSYSRISRLKNNHEFGSAMFPTNEWNIELYKGQTSSVDSTCRYSRIFRSDFSLALKQ